MAAQGSGGSRILKMIPKAASCRAAFLCELLLANHPLTRLSNVVLTPHFGYGVIEVYREYYGQCVENALALLDRKDRKTDPRNEIVIVACAVPGE